MSLLIKAGITKLSELDIDAALAMGAHSITLDAGQTVDGKDVSGLGAGDGDMLKSTYDPNEDGKFAQETQEHGYNPATAAVLFKKIASDDLQHSIDAEIQNYSGSGEWRKDKTLVFDNGIKGVIRVKFETKGPVSGTTVKLTDKDGTLLGAEQVAGSCATYQPKSQDLTIDFSANAEISLWTRDTGCQIYIRYLRFYYANDTTSPIVPVAVTGAD